jgi:PAS domain S-box-containing protein
MAETPEQLRLQEYLLNCVEQAVIATDLNGKIIYWNRYASALYGWTEEEILGRQITEVTPSPQSEREAEEIMKTLRSGGSWAGEFLVRRKDGSEFEAMVRNSPILNDRGEAVGIVGISRDITYRRQMTREREELLRREQAARLAAEEANRTRDRVLGVISHEMRTPLNAILGWTRLLRNQPNDEATSFDAVDAIERNALSQARLIEDILDLNRIASSSLRLTVRNVDIAAVVNSALETARPAAIDKQIDLISEVDNSVGRVLGDSDRIRQIVWNLLSNAIKFTPGNGKVRLTAERSDHTVRITVSDTGRGISPDFMPHLFEPFQQAESTGSKRYAGLGLGLALVRQLVELHHGAVRAESPGDGQGATFSVELPIEGKP